MDPLSLSANIVGVLTVASQLLATGYSYGNSVKDFPDHLREFVGELSSLSGILHALKAVMEDGRTGVSSSEPASVIAGIIATPLEECGKMLEHMVGDLKKYQNPESRIQKVFKRLTWPLKVDETKGWVEKLERYKSTFTLALSADELTLTRTICNNVEEMRNLQALESQRKIMAEKRAKLSKLLLWVSPADAETNHLSAQSLRKSGTGKWFTEGNVFHNWFIDRNSFLWLHGIPGSGKTILSSIIIDRIMSEVDTTTTAIAYFYFDFKESIKQTPLGFLGSIIAQLIRKNPQTLGVLESLYERFDQGKWLPDTWNLELCLCDIIKRLSRAIIVIDALDECSEWVDMFQVLERLRVMTNLSLLITSRTELEMKLEFTNLPSLLINKNDVSVDIENFVGSELQRQPRLARLKLAIKTNIMETLVRGARGMFRWAKCCLDQIVKLRSDKAIKTALGSLPPTLDGVYEMILCNIPEEDRPIAIRILRWLVFCRRPMTMMEVAEGIAVEVGDKSLDPENKLNEPEDIVDICGGLVELDQGKLILELVHFTVKEYLISTGITQGPAASYHEQSYFAHTQLAKICLTYIMFDDFDGGPYDNYEVQAVEYPLLLYAAQYWPEHVSECGGRTEKTLGQLISDFFHLGHNSGKFRTWGEIYELITVYNRGTTKGIDILRHRLSRPLTAPIYFAASLGQYEVVRELLELGADVSTKGGKFGTLLNGAIIGGHEDTMRVLLEKGADPNANKGSPENSLALAAKNGQAGCVQILLDFGADSEYTQESQANPVHAAGWYGHGNAMGVLVEADYFKRKEIPRTPEEFIDTDRNLFGMAYVFSAMQGFDVPFRTLLQREEAMVLSVGQELFFASMRFAVANGHLKIIKAILQSNNAKAVVLRDDIFRTVLQEAAWYGRDKIVDILLSVKKSPGQEVLGFSLHLAAANGNTNSIERLIRAGASPSTKDDEGWCPVLCASEYHNHHAMEKLSTVVDVPKTLDMIDKVGPTSWDMAKLSNLSADGLEIKIGDFEGGVFKALYPITPLSTNYSFEVEIIEKQSTAISIGFGDMLFSHSLSGLHVFDKAPGMCEQSWGYTSYGYIVLDDDMDGQQVQKYMKGDTIGCHFDKIKEVAFFTVNGQIVGKPIADIKGKKVPMIELGRWSHIRTNFGNSPFRYDVPSLTAKDMKNPWRPVAQPMAPIQCAPNV